MGTCCTRITTVLCRGPASQCVPLRENVDRDTLNLIAALQAQDLPSPRTRAAIAQALEQDTTWQNQADLPSPRTQAAILQAQGADEIPRSSTPLPSGNQTDAVDLKHQAPLVATGLELIQLRVQSLQHRLNEQKTDEWLIENCRLCPKCERKIDRIEGCAAMVCGSDTHGPVRGPGCGTKFNWLDAPQYKVEHKTYRDVSRDEMNEMKLFSRFSHSQLVGAQEAIMFALQQANVCMDEINKILTKAEHCKQFRDPDHQWSLMHIICMYPTPDFEKNWGAAWLLHVQGLDIHACTPMSGASPVVLASRNANFGTLGALLEAKADVNGKDGDGHTPLVNTILNRDLNDSKTQTVCSLLCSAGARGDGCIRACGLQQKPKTLRFLAGQFKHA